MSWIMDTSAEAAPARFKALKGAGWKPARDGVNGMLLRRARRTAKPCDCCRCRGNGSCREYGPSYPSVATDCEGVYATMAQDCLECDSGCFEIVTVLTPLDRSIIDEACLRALERREVNDGD
jgi:hypothetical protein